jgi:hypothetical protein
MKMPRVKLKNEIECGWCDDSYGVLCRFEHYPMKLANQDEKFKELLHVVETVNWTLANKRTVHRNKYYCHGLGGAIGLAARIEIASRTVAEDVIALRVASPEEWDDWCKAVDFQDALPKTDFAKAFEDAQRSGRRAKK